MFFGTTKATLCRLNTDEDWIRVGEIVFDAAVVYDGITTAGDVQEPDWYAKTGVLLTSEAVMPFYRYVIRQKGQIELGRLACASCHTRVLPNGTTLKGAQGNFVPGREPGRSAQGASNSRTGLIEAA